MASNGLAKALDLKQIEGTSRHDLEKQAKALVLKLIEKTSTDDLEWACKGARPETN